MVAGGGPLLGHRLIFGRSTSARSALRITFVAACFLAPGCDRPSDQTPFLARVGTSVLTDADLPGSTQSDSSYAALQYINDWVSSELLYQEALRREFDKSETVTEQLATVRRRLAVEALLSDVLFIDSSEVADEAVSAYFLNHQAEFTLAEDVALVSYARFNDRGAGNRFRSGIVRGSTWEEAAEELIVDTLLTPHLEQLAERKYVTKSTLFPEELWKIARTLNAPGVSFVVTTESGYFVLYLHDFRRQGSAPDIPYVAAEIHGRLLILSRRYRYEEFLNELRSRFPVEVRFVSVGSDSADRENSF